MSNILKGKPKSEPTTVRFEPGQLDEARRLRINVSEVSRQALADQISELKGKKSVARKPKAS
jgi:hypothetical protein